MNLGQGAGGGRAINSFIKRAVRMTQPHSISRLQDGRARMQCIYSALTSYILCCLLLLSFLTNIEPLDSAGPAGVESSPQSLQSLQVRSLHLPWHHKQISNQSKAKGEFPKQSRVQQVRFVFLCFDISMWFLSSCPAGLSAPPRRRNRTRASRGRNRLGTVITVQSLIIKISVAPGRSAVQWRVAGVWLCRRNRMLATNWGRW